MLLCRFVLATFQQKSSCPSSGRTSLLPQNADARIATLGRHRRDHFPGVDDRVVTFDAAEERVPVVPGGTTRGGELEGQPCDREAEENIKTTESL